MPAPHIVIIGAGFAGMNAAKVLARSSVRITLIDRTNHHLFQPLLYQVATAGLSPADISAPIRSEFRSFPNVNVILGDVHEVVPAHRQVRLSDGREIDYDYLILATGARHGYFGNDDWEQLAPGLKTLEDAVEIRRRVLLAFERAELEDDKEQRQALLSFVIIGGGPTGVEMAGAIAELARFALSRDFRHINISRTKVILIEAGERILAAFPPHLSLSAEKTLRGLGVQVLTNHRVTGLSEHGVLLGSDIIPTRTVVWAAGVFASTLGAQLGAPCDRAGKVLVNPDLSVPGYANVFVAGDLAAVNRPSGDFVPGMAPGAIQEGRHAAKNILRLINANTTEPFTFFDKGSLATVGRTFAVADIKGLTLTGVAARLIWIFVHIAYLLSFRNKLLVFIQWLWSFVTFKKGARLITGDFNRDYSQRAAKAKAMR